MKIQNSHCNELGAKKLQMYGTALYQYMLVLLHWDISKHNNIKSPDLGIVAGWHYFYAWNVGPGHTYVGPGALMLGAVRFV
jgi:hypothetical protein